MLETISTLKFANRAKNIRNEARVNEDLDQKSLLRKYERELKKLRAELEERSKNVVDKRRLLELDDQVKFNKFWSFFGESSSWLMFCLLIEYLLPKCISCSVHHSIPSFLLKFSVNDLRITWSMYSYSHSRIYCWTFSFLVHNSFSLLFPSTPVG